MGCQQTASGNEDEMTVISDTDGMLWKIRLNHGGGLAEIIPVVETFHSENSEIFSDAGHIIRFPGGSSRITP